MFSGCCMNQRTHLRILCRLCRVSASVVLPIGSLTIVDLRTNAFQSLLFFLELVRRPMARAILLKTSFGSVSVLITSLTSPSTNPIWKSFNRRLSITRPFLPTATFPYEEIIHESVGRCMNLDLRFVRVLCYLVQRKVRGRICQMGWKAK